jgi:hypothetical protein
MTKRQIRYRDNRGQTKVVWRWENQVDSFCRKLVAAGMTEIETRPRTMSDGRPEGWRAFNPEGERCRIENGRYLCAYNNASYRLPCDDCPHPDPERDVIAESIEVRRKAQREGADPDNAQVAFLRAAFNPEGGSDE